MPALTRKAGLAFGGHNKPRKIALPELGEGEFAYIRIMDADDLIRLQELDSELSDADAKTGTAMAAWCVLGMCDEKGKPLFTEADLPKIKRWPYFTLVRCANAIAELNGATEEAMKVSKKDSRSRRTGSRSRSRRT